MPTIREYQSRTNAEAYVPGREARTSDVGGPGLANLGESVSQLGSSIQERTSQLEVTDAYTTAAKLQADNSVALTKAMESADPADSQFSQKFLDGLKPQLDTAGDKYTTPAGKLAWQREAARISAHFVEQAGTYQVKLAGIKGVQDFASLVDSNQIMVNNDPTRYQQVLNATLSALHDPNSTYANINGAQKPEIERAMKSQLANSAMQGYIRFSPDLAMKMLNAAEGPAADVTGEQLNELKTKATVAIRAEETLSEREYLLKKRAQNDMEESVVQDSMKKIFDPKTFGTISDKEIAALPISGERMHTLVDAKFQYARQLAENLENKSHPLVVTKIMDDWIRNDNDPKKSFSFQPVNDALLKGQLSVKEWTYLSDRYNNLKDGHLNTLEHDLQAKISDGQNAIRNSVYFAAQPEEAFSAMTRFRDDMTNGIENYIKQNKDPRAILDPSNPDSPLNTNRRGTYFRTPGTALKEGAKNAVTRNPSIESPKDQISVGTVSKGYRYKGGDPASPNNWEKVK